MVGEAGFQDFVCKPAAKKAGSPIKMVKTTSSKAVTPKSILVTCAPGLIPGLLAFPTRAANRKFDKDYFTSVMQYASA
jgi:hypothetical protein